jgi:hypothetical protein
MQGNRSSGEWLTCLCIDNCAVDRTCVAGALLLRSGAKGRSKQQEKDGKGGTHLHNFRNITSETHEAFNVPIILTAG